jgi:hypothetical protein
VAGIEIAQADTATFGDQIDALGLMNMQAQASSLG